ncbi:uncharacterized protein LOC115924787 [Strongylocentrotus purpuratus]|uniref:Lipocalin/cytosolic fatty-acid binding domain-containing protein n=1 Tax=Strongylocentrotus purpuratus TaxID=7668 RepID=A0A7M7P0T6_STRPU|nr:uncharacterized protein LOC115924787 [Strongylocentrotus purpuratus]
MPRLQTGRRVRFKPLRGALVRNRPVLQRPQEGLRCQSSSYTVKDGYYFYTNESGIDPYGNAYSYQIPVYRSGADPNNVTILYYASETTPGEFKVVFVDYQSYAILHDCNEYLWGFMNVQNNWIIARDRTMSEDDYDDALRYLASMGVNVRKFKKADQEDCPVYRDVPEQDEDPENEDEPRK